MIAFVFPGQGAQSIGMVDSLAAEFPQIQHRFEQASAALGMDLWELVRAGPIEQLNLTQNTQPALLAASVATWDIWQALGGGMPALMAGHSFGEYSALVCAGALAFEDAVTLVADRGRFMQEAVPGGEGAMAAVLGLDREALDLICQEASTAGSVQCANLNAPGQVVISGSKTGVEQASVLAKAGGAKKVIPLAVSVPAHSALMRAAAQKFEARIAGVAVASPQATVVHNVDVMPHSDPSEIRAALVKQLYSPVRWQETKAYFARQGVTRIFECGPGKVLAPLIKRCAPAIETISLTGPAEINAALATIGVIPHE